ncbi:MAG: hypothetical protein NWE89_08410 [Candidatus Bathyarchaeota archaeon]|nr:hypothetical protein [Candidatus Bathyarchaeota archaeon]
MSAKTFALLVIGIILGGAAGYFGNNYLITPRIIELEDNVSQLTMDYEQLTIDHEVQGTEKTRLETQLTELNQSHLDITGQYESLFDEHEALLEQHALLQGQYESLLDQYEASFGGLDLSPESLPVLHREYTWEYGAQVHTVNITVPEPLLDYYSGKDRYSTSDYTGYVVHPYDDAYIEALLNEFEIICALNKYGEEERLGLVTSFVQNLHYETDDTLGFDEYPKFPVETLVDSGGDCEDTSILYSSFLKAMNVSTALIYMPNHMAVAVEANATGTYWLLNNRTYYYLETTATGWELGEVPSEHKYEEVNLYIVDSEPYLNHEWEASIRSNKVTVTMTLTNESPRTAEGYRAWLGLEAIDESIVGIKESTVFNLEFQQTRYYTLIVTGPRYVKMRLMVGVKAPDGTVRNITYSEYFTTK